jgi:small subunit ribosomal protein S4e
MVKNHIKTIAAPRSWAVKRKDCTYVMRPRASGHPLEHCTTLRFLLVELLHLAHTTREATYIVHDKEVLVNGKRRKNTDFGIGLLDAITIPELEKHYRITIDNKGKLIAKEIDAKEALMRLCRIKKKTSVKGKTQLNLSDGTNLLIEKDTYGIGDVLVLESPKNHMKSHLKLEKGCMILLTGGKSIGSVGKVEDIPKYWCREGSE